jgi:selenocysteine lyase/cysteine desulfurase
MGYDVQADPRPLPGLAAGAAHFDGPGGSQVPDTVAAAVADTLLSPLANRARSPPPNGPRTRSCWRPARMGDLLGVDPRGVVFGRSMTALSFDLARTLAATWGPGDEVIVTRLDHDANIRPWMRAAEAVGAACGSPTSTRARPSSPWPTWRASCRRAPASSRSPARRTCWAPARPSR